MSNEPEGGGRDAACAFYERLFNRLSTLLTKFGGPLDDLHNLQFYTSPAAVVVSLRWSRYASNDTEREKSLLRLINGLIAGHSNDLLNSPLLAFGINRCKVHWRVKGVQAMLRRKRRREMM